MWLPRQPRRVLGVVVGGWEAGARAGDAASVSSGDAARDEAHDRGASEQGAAAHARGAPEVEALRGGGAAQGLREARVDAGAG
uniref:Peroxisomal biogenesis factor 19 n=1 Tax=Arundo donax TaxID=35708 RepID=A0A0A9G2A0_ARUDO